MFRITMQGIKFVLVVALAVCTTQCQAGEFPISADRVDLRLFVENGAAIARNLFKAVNTGLDQSKPHMDKILNELAPEARTFLRKLIDEARAKINEEDKRVTVIFATLTKALDDLKPIKTCSDKVSPAAKQLALATEKNITLTIQGVQNKYKKEIENVKVGVEKTVQKARKLFDTEVKAVVGCLKPGRKDSSACLDKEVDKILNGIGEILGDIFILIQTANDFLPEMSSEIVDKLLPVMEKVLNDGRVLLKTLGDCVALLK